MLEPLLLRPKKTLKTFSFLVIDNLVDVILFLFLALLNLLTNFGLLHDYVADVLNCVELCRSLSRSLFSV